jgi:hypothetical protein
MKYKNNKHVLFAKMFLTLLYKQYKNEEFDTLNFRSKFLYFEEANKWYHEFGISVNKRKLWEFGSFTSYTKWIKKISNYYYIEKVNHNYCKFKIRITEAEVKEISSELFIYRLMGKKCVI